VALSFLELLVAVVQAYIFTFLSTLYIGSSVSSEH
jgi:F0F1-type ATP synthase membrane subunit a